ncbi:MAG: hypothetical protein R3348_07270 [Xanthomonadales bacterium]|nr:hypothetical protein [Xanthomonadales bacterium]
MAAPVNDTQKEFAELCKMGGGFSGGPAKGKVLELLRASGKRLNEWAFQVMEQHLSAFPSANPWHVCFAVGLSWGHLAKLDLAFTEHAVGALSDWNDADISAASGFYLERGPEPIEKSLAGAYRLFSLVKLPETLPTSLVQLGRAQERWFSPIQNPSQRPPYIGSWNATAMFMTALFAQPSLARTQIEATPLLPPGGPITEGLRMLHKAKIVSRSPAGTSLDDAAFEPGAIYENNALMVELVSGLDHWSLSDVHSGLYMLGTRDPRSVG